jgi:diadenosine tetraphosphatase ApaH/serine/threonine PP2A family protein phosphatase
VHALQAVLDSIGNDAVAEVWCLGDLVGYGPQPNLCCALVRERAAVCLVGNHDLGVLGELDLADFSYEAAASARWTQGVLERESRDFLGSLAPAGEREGIGLYHASPRDPVWEYVLSVEVALASLAIAPQPLVLVGHSHVALALGRAGDTAVGGHAPAGTEIELDAADALLLNPGSVGQPRDGDRRAAYLLLDLEARRASFRRVDYAVAETQREIREAGLPEPLAVRLEHGL